MRSSAFVLSALLLATACTESQDLGDRPEVDGGLLDGNDGDGSSDEVTDGNGPLDGDSNTDDPDDSDNPVDTVDDEDPVDERDTFQFGTFQAFQVKASGLGADVYTTLGVTSFEGANGCGVASQPDGAPGEAGARAYANVYAQDGRCPVGLYSIKNDPGECDHGDDVGANCALYQRWDDTGKLVTNVLATGGVVSVEFDEERSPVVCRVELSLRFPGGRVEHTFEVEYADDGESFCAR